MALVYVAKGFKPIRDKVVVEVGSFYMDDLEDEGTLSTIRDPVGSRLKG